MASGVVDAVLIPEVPFKPQALCDYLGGVVKQKGHCVVCIAEGAGQVRQRAPRPPHAHRPRKEGRAALPPPHTHRLLQPWGMCWLHAWTPLACGGACCTARGVVLRCAAWWHGACVQDLLEDGSGGTDASGNPILKDIGTYLKGEIKKRFADADIK